MAVLLQKALFRAGAMTRAADNKMEQHDQYPITLVTAYFELGGKPGLEKNPYPGWLRNLLPHVRWPLVIFCDEQSLDMLREARGDKPAVWHVTRPEEFYAYRYLDDLKRMSFPVEYGASFTREAFVTRSLVWHEKHHFLQQAMSENPFGSEMFFWCDIGISKWSPDAPWWAARRMMFRLFEDTEWPNLRVCRALPQDKVILVASTFAGGSHFTAQFFGGAVEPSRRWCDAYYHRLEKRKQNGSFSVTEEWVMVSCWKRRQELAHVILPDSVPYMGLLAGGRRRVDYKWYFLNGRRFPWRYFFRRPFSGLAR